MHYLISKKNRDINGEVDLPSSKSISNRALILNALSYSPYDVQNLSDSDDTRVLDRVLNSESNRFDIGHAGTAMRFLTAYLSKIVGEWHLTGSERMQQRPISILVDSLRLLGAQIEYSGKEGYPPLRITGTALKGGILELDGSVSSQYISALLMIAPTLQGGLTIRLKNKTTSGSYIELTLELMKHYGISYQWNGNVINIEEQIYKPVPITVEADWSGASYWYAIASLSDRCNILLKGLMLNSLQGDVRQAKWFDSYFSLLSMQENGAVRIIRKQTKLPDNLSINFIDNPDLAQTFVVIAICLNIPFRFNGLLTLKIKETDRIAALQMECAKYGVILTEPSAGELVWDGKLSPTAVKSNPIIETYHDHRMALAFAPMALKFGEVRIADPMVVTKSYPTFYEDLKNAGFEVKECS